MEVDTHKLHNKLKEILKVFADICEENNLRYFLIAGTLLGAVRHQDIIPWDDDIDVGMPRADYDRFLKIAQEKLDDKHPNKYFLQTYKTDKHYPRFFAKIRDNDTARIGKINIDIDMNHGVSIDIFLLDGLPDNKDKQVKIAKKVRYLNYFTGFRHKSEYKTGKKIMIPIKFIIRHTTSNALYQKLAHKTITKYDYDKSNFIGSLLSNYGIKAFFNKSLYENYIMLPLGDREYTCPSEYVAILKQLYGDYMQYPPIEKRGARHNVSFYDLDNSYLKYKHIEYLIDKNKLNS